MKRTIINLLKNAAEQYENKTYAYDKTENGWRSISFKNADLLSSFIAIELLNYKFQPYDKIAILSEGRSAWALAEFGILKIKGTSVPLSIKLLPEELIFRLNHSEAKGIFTSLNNLEKVLSIYNRLEQENFKIIIFNDLNEDKNVINKILEKHKFEKNNVIFFNDLIENGKNNYQKTKDKLEQIIKSIEEEDIATLSYTSGTTGDPKGIMLTHKNYYHNTNQSVAHFRNDIHKFAKNFVILPVDHSFAHTAAIYAALGFPFTLYFLDARGGGMQALKNIPINLKEVQPDFMYTVPALTGNFMKKIQENISKQNKFVQFLFNIGLKAGIKKIGDGVKRPNIFIRAILSIPHSISDFLIFRKIRESFGNYKFTIGGGALLDITQQKFFAAIGLPIMQGYGLSEATPVISSNKPSDFRFGSSGKPLPDLEVKIIRDGKEVKRGEKGEIIVKGENVMKGYFKNPEATAKTIKNGWLYTGDMGYFDKYGFLYVTGREKALLIGEDGEKFSPEEIEETIQSNSAFIFQIMLYNDHSKFTSAIITLDENYIKDYITKNNITDANILFKEIEKSLSNFKHDRTLRNKFPNRWLPKAFVIAPEAFTEQNKMLNSTLKMVRYKIIEVYNPLIELIYNSDSNKLLEHNIKVIENKLFKQ